MNTYDESWKEVVEKFFSQFLEFFFPQIAEGIDFGKEVVFLDKELAKINKKGFGGKRVDKLARVYRKDGEEQWLLAHVEVQGYRDEISKIAKISKISKIGVLHSWQSLKSWQFRQWG